MINYVIFIFKRFAWFKRFYTRLTYEILARKVKAPEWQFMNYGYVPSDADVAQPPATDAPQRYPLQMYHYLASKVDLSGKSVLEVGSGRGGGAKYIATALQPVSYTGMDIAQSAVDLANTQHKAPNLTFIQGSAESIPLPDESVDVVINVESCHAYGCVDSFLRESKRVLRKGGYLLLVDFRDTAKMDILREQMERSGMQCLQEENISDNVVKAIEAENDTKLERIRQLFPARWQKLFSEFAGVSGSRIHTMLRDRTKLYHRFVLQKV